MKIQIKHILLINVAGMLAFAQSPPDSPVKVPATTQSARMSKSLPQYLVYRHFLDWVSQLDQEATTSGKSADPYEFAKAFSRADLEPKHLDLLKSAAQSLHADLEQHQKRAQVLIDRYRAEARDLLAAGKPLPPAPPEIRQLERERTALLVHHYVHLRASLGPDTSAKLDRYLGYEFAPHIQLRQ